MNRMLEDHEHENDWPERLLVGCPWTAFALAVLANPLEPTEKRSVRAWSI
jgi:hypothetical protein